MKGILVGVKYPQMTYDFEVSMQELEQLAFACDIEVKTVVIQNLEVISPKYYIGKGKVMDIGELLETDDIVIFNEELTPLQMKNLTPENIEALIQQQKRAAEVRRNQLSAEQNKGQQEIEPQEQESIKDEIGDEFKPKTQQQEQEEQQVETMWQNRFQLWDRDSVNLPNGAKRKEEAVKVIQDIEREKQAEVERKEQQTDNSQR